MQRPGLYKAGPLFLSAGKTAPGLRRVVRVSVAQSGAGTLFIRNFSDQRPPRLYPSAGQP